VAAQASPGPGVELALDATLPPLVTDAERLRVALVNLLVNARHAVEIPAQPFAVGGSTPPEPIVRLSTRRHGTVVAIGVTDNGVGIDGSDLGRIFDPYFTTKRGGTGLGLPIAKNIVEGLGGTIGITSRQGSGTEIRVELPLNAVEGAGA
jgi:signal transduction histidine kinase